MSGSPDRTDNWVESESELKVLADFRSSSETCRKVGSNPFDLSKARFANLVGSTFVLPKSGEMLGLVWLCCCSSLASCHIVVINAPSSSRPPLAAALRAPLVQAGDKTAVVERFHPPLIHERRGVGRGRLGIGADLILQRVADAIDFRRRHFPQIGNHKLIRVLE